VVTRAGDDRVDELTREALESVGDHRYAQGTLLRATGLMQDDETSLRKSLAVFEEIECPYQAARTGWLLGGADRAAAERKLEALGATLPVD
jgi:hypothetical protein